MVDKIVKNTCHLCPDKDPPLHSEIVDALVRVTGNEHYVKVAGVPRALEYVCAQLFVGLLNPTRDVSFSPDGTKKAAQANEDVQMIRHQYVHLHEIGILWSKGKK